jgi:hypothetical protein
MSYLKFFVFIISQNYEKYLILHIFLFFKIEVKKLEKLRS